jgi:hypothetical protein
MMLRPSAGKSRVPQLGIRSARWLVVALAAVAGASARADGVASVEATASVASPEIALPKGAARDLKHVLGPDAAEILKAEMVRELVDLQAFTAVLPEGGDIGLTVRLLRMSRSFTERGGRTGESGDVVRVEIEAECRWNRGETPLHGTTLTLGRSIPVDDTVLRNDLQLALRSLFRELAQRSFGELYEARFYGKAAGRSGSGNG